MIGIQSSAYHVHTNGLSSLVPYDVGTRLLSPFVWTWYALDWMPIIDVYLWLTLASALVVGTIKRPRSAAFLAMGLMAFDYSARAVLHDRALTRGASSDATGMHAPCATAPTFVAHATPIDNPAVLPTQCVQAAALPTFLSPFTWRIVRQHRNGYELSDRNILEAQAPVQSSWLVNETGPDIQRVRTTRPGRVYFDFARFPIARVSTPTPALTTIRLLDARFIGMPFDSPDHRGGARLSVVVTLDASGRVVEERFGN